jgi:hypothetical protein
MKVDFVMRSMLLFILFLKTYAKVGYQKGFDKKQFTKNYKNKWMPFNTQNTN